MDGNRSEISMPVAKAGKGSRAAAGSLGDPFSLGNKFEEVEPSGSLGARLTDLNKRLLQVGASARQGNAISCFL
jgi:hypothetical protein